MSPNIIAAVNVFDHQKSSSYADYAHACARTFSRRHASIKRGMSKDSWKPAPLEDKLLEKKEADR